MPGAIFVVDSKKEQIAIKEARLMNIPLIGLIDTNCNPDDVDICIPGNDDAIRAIKLIAGSLADAVIEAREGIEIDRSALDEDDFDIASALENTDVTAAKESELAEDAANKKAKKKTKKPAKKPVEKKEETKKEEVKTEEKVAESEEK